MIHDSRANLQSAVEIVARNWTGVVWKLTDGNPLKGHGVVTQILSRQLCWLKPIRLQSPPDYVQIETALFPAVTAELHTAGYENAWLDKSVPPGPLLHGLECSDIQIQAFWRIEYFSWVKTYRQISCKSVLIQKIKCEKEIRSKTYQTKCKIYI